MSFETIAEDLIVLEPLTSPAPMGAGIPFPLGHSHPHSHSAPHSHQGMHDLSGEPTLVVNDPVHIDIIVEEIPGAGDEVPEVPIVVEEVEEDHENHHEKDEADVNDARKSKKSEKWDWESKGASGFVSWIKERLDTVPRHSGMDSAGLERAISYLEKLDSEISKAMRLDLEGDLDANKIEEVRAKMRAKRAFQIIPSRKDKVYSEEALQRWRDGNKKQFEDPHQIELRRTKCNKIQGMKIYHNYLRETKYYLEVTQPIR